MDALRNAVSDPPAAHGADAAAGRAVLTGAARGKPIDNLELVENLCAVSPPLREARRLHVSSLGTLIPHVFMAAVLARVGQCLLMGSEHAQREHGPEIAGILAALEQGMRCGDRETRNVIAISFVRDSEVELFFSELKQWLGPQSLGQTRGR